MTLDVERVAIVGATGATGRELAAELSARGVAVRAASRSRENLERCFPGGGVELAVADALDAAAVGAAVEGCDVVVDCIGLPPERMDDHAATARVVVRAAREAGARCLQVSSYWSFLPVQRLPLDETRPRKGGNHYIRARRAAEDVMLENGAAVVHLPDFFGPHVHASTLQMALEEAAAGKTMNWIGSSTTQREYVYVPDAMRIVADLIGRDEAYGRSWIVPGSGPLNARRVAEIAGEHLGRQVAVRAAPRWLLTVLSLVSSDLRAFRPMVAHYVRPIRYDGADLIDLLGAPRITPNDEAIPATLDWIRASHTT